MTTMTKDFFFTFVFATVDWKRHICAFYGLQFGRTLRIDYYRSLHNIHTAYTLFLYTLGPAYVHP